ncbi:unnamed protein product [Lactuca saligna]|uniref:Uncharacterized protein n=1 Tax=Lactuca saligna TaxID=75948 RepID=A0AA36EHT9_LACSI|nr:unnamed protein product [Lactuca saligna]
MEQLHISNVPTRKWYFCFLLISIFSKVEPSTTPDANLLCISECGTCPVICSPPPSPPAQSKPPSLPIESKPPPSPSKDDSEPPPYLTPIYHATPPPPSRPQLTPSSPPRTKSCPPPSYITMGTNAPPPPPPPKVVVVPSTQVPAVEPKNNPYPYYYFYTSKGVTFSVDFTGFVIVFLSFHVIFLLLG